MGAFPISSFSRRTPFHVWPCTSSRVLYLPPSVFPTNRLTHSQLCILYLLAFLDRANIGNAKIAGLTTDLNLSTSQFNATLTIFFVSYSVFEPLTNVLLKRLRPSIFIPLIM